MSRSIEALLVAALIAASAPAAAQGKYPGVGRVATPAEIAAWDIDVRPDGRGLPPGSGSVAQGQRIYDEKCASCHGTFGESNDYMAIAGGVGTLSSDQPIRTTGSKLNYATTLWDYINRAMPFAAPKSLTADEVYALLQGAGAALCLSEREDNAPPPLVRTAPWGYLRLRLENYEDADLAAWAQRIADTGWDESFAYFMHEPTAPGYAQALQRIAASG